MKLIDGLYAYSWMDPSTNNANSYAIRTGITVVVDPGHRRFVGQLLQSMRLDGLHEDTIQGVICTHAHPDHMEGVHAVSSRPIWAAVGIKDEEFLRHEGEDLYAVMGMPMPQVRFDVLLKEGDLILGGERFQVLETPGHTPGSICIYWPSRKALITGDVIFELGVGRTDFPGGDGQTLVDSLEKLAKLDVEILLAGHGNPIVGRERVKQNFQMVRETHYAALR